MIRRQLARWTIVGLATNASLYVVYLLLTGWALTPRIAMTLVYIVGVGLGFVGHRQWSFEHTGPTAGALGRYVVAYIVGYLVNLAGLSVGTDVLGAPHQAVQAFMIIVVAVLMFVIQKYFVFRVQARSEDVTAGSAS